MDEHAKREIPRLKGHWLLGSLPDFKKAPHDFLASALATGEGLIKFRILNREMIGILDVDCAEAIFKTNSSKYPRGEQRKHLESLMGLGLLTLKGDTWKQHRRLVAQAFRPEFLKHSLEQNTGLIASFLDRWEARLKDQQPIDAAEEMQQITLQAIIKALFSADIDPEKDRKVSEAIIHANDLMYQRYFSLVKLPDWFPTKLNRQLADARQAMIDYAGAQIEAKQAKIEEEPQDIVDYFIDLQSQGEMTFDEIYDEIRTLLIAGFETSATSLSWSLYLLAKNPHVQERWQKELDSVLDSQPPSWETIKQLTFTEHIFMEAMRLYPPGYMLSRTCQEDDQVEGYSITHGTPVLLSIYSIHRSPKYWKDPDEFIPERFESDWPERAYFPFGIGRHVCIGNRFAMLESILILASIGQRFTLSLADNTEVTPDPRVTLIPGKEILVNLEPR